MVTRDGCCLGLDVATGRGATVSWQEAEGGVLCAAPAALAAALAVAAAPDLAKISGFSPQGAAQEIITENSFRESISTPEIIKFHRYLTAEPHPAGSARNNELAQWCKNSGDHQ